MKNKLCYTAAMLLLALPACGQALPDAPESKAHFLTGRNVALLTLAGAGIAADEYTTQKFMAWPLFQESNPLTRPFGRSRGASVGLGVAAFAGTAGGMYLAHRRHWHRLEWIIPTAVTAVEAGFAIHNAAMDAPHLHGPVAHIPIHFIP